jgi:FKBP-type peptidyl-prolyl cis-trans isomerase FkpA
MLRIIRRLALLAIATVISACDPPVQELKDAKQDPVSEQFVKANQYMYQRHQDHISAFIERAGWKAELMPSGLWIVIEKPGTGPRIGDNSRVTFSFESSMLDGTPCYSATPQKPKVITVGKGGVESGVEQGLRKLADGAEAIFLIPPHLGHGNFGDRDKIPGNTVLIYRIQVLELD